MTMPNSQIDVQSLSTMLQINPVNRHEWSAVDLSEMLNHQLAAPLHLALGPLSGEVSHFLNVESKPSERRMTLKELFGHPHPPLVLLKLVKRFAKICRKSLDNPLPGEIVMFLYYASIAVAALELNEAISDLNDASMIRGLRWLCVQPWMSDEMRTMLQNRLESLLLRSFVKSE